MSSLTAAIQISSFFQRVISKLSVSEEAIWARELVSFEPSQCTNGIKTPLRIFARWFHMA